MSKLFGKILVVDDDEDILHALRLLLKKHCRLVHTEKNPKQIPTLLKNEDYDLILLDMNFTQDVTSGREGFFWLDKILDLAPSAVVILITAYGDVETAVQAIKAGATDFVLKPWQNERLLATLSSAMRLRQSRVETNRLRSRQRLLSADLDHRFQDFIGGAASAMQRVFETIDKVAKTDVNVLILGENGTGKELVARALHRASNRADEVFVAVDMGAITETLFESELFGHVKGAFTDAKEDRVGRFEVASGGTLFLDEIGNLSMPLQAKLLTAIQRREVTRVGANKPTPVDVRLICAANMPIYEMVKEKTFRQDLLYRINTVEIRMPPLRERADDIPLLVERFLDRFCTQNSVTRKTLSSAALERLVAYPWPGNVRELQNVVERFVLMTASETIDLSALPRQILSPEPDKRRLSMRTQRLADAREVFEREFLTEKLRENGGNISRTADVVGLKRESLSRKLRSLGIDVERARDAG